MKRFNPIFIAMAATIPGICLRIFAIELNPIIMTILTAAAIFSASFILTWACEVMQLDIPQAVAVAAVALIAVLPEYAVDMYFTWMAGKYPESDYVHYAIANMTGANRLLIGVGWSAVILLFAYKFGKKIFLENEHKTEILFLTLATLYAFTIPLKSTLNLMDSAVFIGIFIWYIVIIIRKPVHEEELNGVAKALGDLPKRKRVLVTWLMFAFSAIVILMDAEIFSESIVASGKLLGINEFLLVQWLAPVASEAPEFIIAIMFTLRGQAGLALGSLISSKLNQWTLLVGMIPIVYAVSSGSLTHMPLASQQMHELLLTAAQSLFAISLVCALVVGKKEAFSLLILFLIQFASPLYADYFTWLFNFDPRDHFLIVFSVIYLVFACFMLIYHRKKFFSLIEGLKVIKQ